ncbi:hypothetical protein LD119_00108 [Mesoplasma sp. JKS002660]|uniref:lipoprotein n=1 Tax=Mesoplasma whartonense TaxID=2878854 RepID=UPI002022B54F|nr:lipoprotein [Mesoplasma sp. JKS002660]MCL8213182.1 hypothetical protein [Mesoplasma sp. JKS002660]
MRKLITILGAVGLFTTATTSVVACTNNQQENLNPTPDPDETKILLNEKITINDDNSITVILFYYDGSEVALFIPADDSLNPIIKELKIEMDQINQSLDSNNKELTTTIAGLSSFEKALLKDSQTISKVQVVFDGVEAEYKAVEKILNQIDENSEGYQQIKNLFEIAKDKLNQAQKQLTYAKNIYKMNVENEVIWRDKITWLEDNVATIKSEKLAKENDLLTRLQTARLI